MTTRTLISVLVLIRLMSICGKMLLLSNQSKTLLPDSVVLRYQLQFNTSATISVDMPSNLMDTFYLALHQHVQIQSGNAPTVRSAPFNASQPAMTHLPQLLSVLLVIVLGAFGFSLLM
ncbi:hypothetical protein BCR42DRAFT_392615 [Absidia repens]|uniref:Uncharacterized protein n=1 Tax=Absidia repens TaxID=90262 RepID=A0A1X2IFF7_9FUNG|nr:hypothetical protein BCR42DRAFT_392615 [Absidia repens]